MFETAVLQAVELSTATAKWSGFDGAEAPIPRLGQVAEGSVTVTPGVVTESVPAIEVSPIVPSFVSVTGSTAVSPGSRTPLPWPGPPEAHTSLIVTPAGVAW